MKLKSISGLVYTVSDLQRSADFYQKLGFYLEKREADMLMVRINWFSVEFYEGAPAPGDGQQTLVSIENVDDMYQELQKNGIECEAPKIGNNGRRELLVSDPDGYQLVFFDKNKA